MDTDTGAFLTPFVVTDGSGFRLQDHDPDVRGWDRSKKETDELIQAGVERLAELQETLYAQDRWGLLVIIQAMDAAGKDGVIKHVMSGINPQGCEVRPFKVPSAEELDHDFMWRAVKALPERGRIGIFNRSYYEEVLVVRVHPEVLRNEKLPPSLVTKAIWTERFEDINAFERYLARNGYAIRKFFLNVSRSEQRKRFLERIDEAEKNWKFSLGDVKERDYWRAYMAAYEEMIQHTATPHAPWIVVPADNKRFARLVVAAAVIDALEGLRLAFPKVDEARRKELEAARAKLEAD